MMTRKGTGRKDRENRDHIGNVRMSIGKKIHERIDHLLIEVLFKGFFLLSCRLKAAFRVK